MVPLQCMHVKSLGLPNGYTVQVCTISIVPRVNVLGSVMPVFILSHPQSSATNQVNLDQAFAALTECLQSLCQPVSQ